MSQQQYHPNQWGWAYDPVLGFAFAIHHTIPNDVLRLASGHYYHRQALINLYRLGQLPAGGLQQPSHSLPQGWPNPHSDSPQLLHQQPTASPIPAVQPGTNPHSNQIVHQQSHQIHVSPAAASDGMGREAVASKAAETNGGPASEHQKKSAAKASKNSGELSQDKSKGGKTQDSGKLKGGSKAKGQGAKSKANRREPGASEDETGDLTKEQAASADIKLSDAAEDQLEWTEHQTKIVVEYICEQEIKDKWKTRKTEVFTHRAQKIGQKIVTNNATVAQVRNMWNRIWDKYKACRRRQMHTGGGDPDDPQGEDDEGDESPGGEESGKGKKKKKKKKKKSGFSDQLLDDFESSAIYDLIDQAFHDDPTAVPEEVFSSLSKLIDVEKDGDDAVEKKQLEKQGKPKRRSAAPSSSDGEGFDEEGPSAIVSSLVATLKEKNERLFLTASAWLAMEERRDERERAESDRKRRREEAEETRRGNQLREETISKWMEEYQTIKDSTDEMEQVRAAYLCTRLKEAMSDN